MRQGPDAYLMGQAHRIGHLRRALRHLREKGGAEVWFTTAAEIAGAYAGIDPEPHR